MKRVILVGLFWGIFCPLQGMSDTLHSSEHFTFHNNLWVNLHHYLYELASERQLSHLKKDGSHYMDIGDSLAFKRLSVKDSAIMGQAIRFYRDSVIDKPLLFSGKRLRWLQAQSTARPITVTGQLHSFAEVLNRVRPIYQREFWPRHQRHNLQLLNEYLAIIEQTENTVIEKMEGFSGLQWRGKVRVDLSTYGNWASAYSPNDDNIVLSSIDPALHSSLFIEFVFHESSHLLFSRKAPFRIVLFKTARELELTYPRNLWHAAMFYLSGVATKEALNTHGIDHQLIMPQKGVFLSYYQNEAFREILDRYYFGEITQAAMARALLLRGPDTVQQ